MKRFFGVLALVCVASTASAQSALRINTSLGSFTPMLPVIAVDDTRNPDVELESATATTLELGYAARSWATLYGGLTYAQPRLVLSGALESNQVNGASSRTNILIPTAGVMLSRQLGRTSIRPSARLGIGVKSYKFDLAEQDDRVGNLTGDLGLGLSAGEGPVTMTAEARWLPSTFNARSLPIRATGNTDQQQNDWIFQLGFRFRP
ncbi:MAG TPA: hypothetical protein VF584_09200 [Longimicrobium sp.]|jgi:hypothetical protein